MLVLAVHVLLCTSSCARNLLCMHLLGSFVLVFHVILTSDSVSAVFLKSSMGPVVVWMTSSSFSMGRY